MFSLYCSICRQQRNGCKKFGSAKQWIPCTRSWWILHLRLARQKYSLCRCEATLHCCSSTFSREWSSVMWVTHTDSPIPEEDTADQTAQWAPRRNKVQGADQAVHLVVRTNKTAGELVLRCPECMKAQRQSTVPHSHYSPTAALVKGCY